MFNDYDWKFRHKDNALASRGLPNSYPAWRNFQFAPNNHYRFFFLHTIPLTFKLESALFLSILGYNKYILYREMFGCAPIYDVLQPLI